MGGMMEANGGVEYRARGRLDVGDLERALLHAVGQDCLDLVAEAFLVRTDRLTGFLRQRQIGREHFGIAGQFLVLGAKVRALLQGRAYVTIEDIQTLAYPTLRHRILLNYRAEAEGVTVETVLGKLLEAVKGVAVK